MVPARRLTTTSAWMPVPKTMRPAVRIARMRVEEIARPPSTPTPRSTVATSGPSARGALGDSGRALVAGASALGLPWARFRDAPAAPNGPELPQRRAGRGARRTRRGAGRTCERASWRISWRGHDALVPLNLTGRVVGLLATAAGGGRPPRLPHRVGGANCAAWDARQPRGRDRPPSSITPVSGADPEPPCAPRHGDGPGGPRGRTVCCGA